MNNTNLACFFSKFIDNQLPSVIKLKIGYFWLNHHASPLNKSCSSSLKETLGASTKNIIFLTSVVNNILSLPPQPSSQKFADVLKTSLTPTAPQNSRFLYVFYCLLHVFPSCACCSLQTNYHKIVKIPPHHRLLVLHVVLFFFVHF